MGKRLLVTGSRTWTDVDVIERALGDAVDYLDDITLVVGDARGADEIAQYVWLQYEPANSLEVHRADWKRYGKQAGYIRNAEMVNSGIDLCLAFIKDNSKGATMTAKLCEKLGIKTRIFGDEHILR